MKKIISLTMLTSALFLAACNDETKTVETVKPAPAAAPAPAKTEVIVVNPAPAVVVKDPPAKSTTITLDKNGVKVGTKKVEVVIQKDNK